MNVEDMTQSSQGRALILRAKTLVQEFSDHESRPALRVFIIAAAMVLENELRAALPGVAELIPSRQKMMAIANEMTSELALCITIAVRFRDEPQ